MVKGLVLMVFLLTAAIVDQKKHKISNFFLLEMGIVGMALNMMEAIPIVILLKGMFIPLVLLLPLWCIHCIGAGDIKLMCMVGIYLGNHISALVFYSLLWCGIIGLLMMIKRKQFICRMLNAIVYLDVIIKSKKVIPYGYGIGSSNALLLPFAICILLGVYTTWVIDFMK